MSAPVAALRVLVTEVTEARSGRTHLVTEAAFAVGCRSGCYPALCGRDVLAASLAMPGVGYCRACVALWRVAR